MYSWYQILIIFISLSILVQSCQKCFYYFPLFVCEHKCLRIFHVGYFFLCSSFMWLVLLFHNIPDYFITTCSKKLKTCFLNNFYHSWSNTSAVSDKESCWMFLIQYLEFYMFLRNMNLFYIFHVQCLIMAIIYWIETIKLCMNLENKYFNVDLYITF